MATMPTLSIRQPWPWAMLCLPQGERKDVENRSWPTKHRGPILIHASKSFQLGNVRKEFALFMARRKAFGTPIADAETFMEMRAQAGGIVGMTTIVGCVRDSASPWAIPGEWHWLLADSRPLPFWACKGRLGVFDAEYPYPLEAAC